MSRSQELGELLTLLQELKRVRQSLDEDQVPIPPPTTPADQNECTFNILAAIFLGAFVLMALGSVFTAREVRELQTQVDTLQQDLNTTSSNLVIYMKSQGFGFKK